VKVEVIGLGIQGFGSTWGSLIDAVVGNSVGAHNLTPQALWEVEIGSVLASGGGLDSELDTRSKHDVDLLVVVSTSLSWELEEQWLVESSSLLRKHGQLGVVVSDHRVLDEDCSGHDLGV
jgi:hypothetical protein